MSSKKILILFALALVFSLQLSAQDIKFGGTQPPDTAVLNLLGRYQEAATNYKTIAERDAKRKPLVSEGYFYHGMDASAVDFDSLTRRQTKNNFQGGYQDSLFDIHLFQYENTAILTYKVFGKGMDKGKAFEGYSSSLVVMSKENGRWKIVSDIIGQDPKIKKQ